MSACGGSDPGIYQFDEVREAGVKESKQEPFTSTEESIVIRLSDELRGAVSDYMTLGIEQFTIHPSVTGAGLCRLDVDIEYPDGAKEQFGNRGEIGMDEQDVMDEITPNFIPEQMGGTDRIVPSLPNDDQIQEDVAYVTEDLSQATLVQPCDDGPDEPGNERTLYFPLLNTQHEAFAGVGVAIVPEEGGGVTTILTGTVRAAEPDEDGNWRSI